VAGSGIWLDDATYLQTAGQIWAQQQQQTVQAGHDWAQQQIADTLSKLQAMVPQVPTGLAPTPTPAPPPVTLPQQAPPSLPTPAPPPPLPIGGTPVATPMPDAGIAPPAPAPTPQAPVVPPPPPTPSLAEAGQNWAQQQIQNLLNPSQPAPSSTTPTTPTPDLTPPAPTLPSPLQAQGTSSGPQPNAPGDLIDQTRQAATGAGIDPDLFARQINQESGFNPSAGSPAGAQGIAQFMPDTARGLGIDPSDPAQALPAAANLMKSYLAKYAGDWSKALAAYNAGPGNVDKYGGVPPFEETQTYIKNILGDAKDVVQQGLSSVNTAVQGVQSAVAARASQFGLGLSSGDAMAFCGPTAAIAFAQTYGRNPTVVEAKQLAQQVGWNPDQGMAGPQSEVSLLKTMGVDAHMTSGVDWAQVGRDASGGNPVIIDTPGHYYYVDGYNQQTGQLHVGTSGTDLKGGSEWMTPDQINSMPQSHGGARAAIFADHPLAQQDGLAQSVGRGQNLTMGTMQPAPPDLGQQVGQVLGNVPLPMIGLTANDIGASAASLQQGRDIIGSVLQPDQSAPAPLRAKADNILQAVQDVGSKATQAGADLLKQGQEALQQAPQTVSDILTQNALTSQGIPNIGGTLLEGAQALGRNLDPNAMNANPLMPSNILSGAEQALGNKVSAELQANPIIGSDIRKELFPTIFDPGFMAKQQLANSAITKLTNNGFDETALTPEERAAWQAQMQQVFGLEMPEMPSAEAVGALTGATRMFHGTGADFPTASPERVGSEANLYGPGYYLTSDPRVAGGVVANQAVAPGMPGGGVERGAVLRPGYAQARQASLTLADVDRVRRTLESNLGLDPQISRVVTADLRGMTPDAATGRLGELLSTLQVPKENMNALIDEALPGRAGPNMRAVDVPQGLQMFDVDAPLSAADTDAIRQALPVEGQQAMDRFVAASDNWAKPPTGDDLYQYLSSPAEGGMSRGQVNRALSDAGYDGLNYAGGGRVPMPDLTGKPIEHQATVIFPESLDKIRNAISGRQGGQVSPQFATSLAGGAGGAVTGYQTADENATPQERLQRAALFGAIGLGAGYGAGRLAEPGQLGELLRGESGQVNLGAVGAGPPRGATAGAGAPSIGDWLRGAYRGGVIGGLNTMADVAFNSTLTPALSGITGIARDLGSFQPGRIQGRVLGAQSGIVNWTGNFLQGLTDSLSRPTSLSARAGPGAPRVVANLIEGMGALHGAFQNATSELIRSMEVGAAAGETASAQGLHGPSWFQEFHNNVQNPDPVVAARAQAMGDRTAARGDLGQLTGAFGRFVNAAGPIGDALFPVYRMGMALASRMVESTPLGLAGTAADVARGLTGRGPYAALQQTGLRGALDVTPAGSAVGPIGERLANNLIGTALSMWLANKAVGGAITGNGPSDPGERKVWIANGNQPNSFLGPDGAYHSWEKLPPALRGPMMTAGAYADAVQAYNVATARQQAAGPDAYGVQDPRVAAAAQLVSEVGQQLASATPMRTFANLYDALQSNSVTGVGLTAAGDVASSVLGATVPASGLVRSVAQMSDPTQRQVLTPRTPQELPQSVLENVAQNIPGLRQGLPARLDVLGRPIGNPLQGLGELLPVRTAAGQPTELLQAMQAAGVAPSPTPQTIPYGPTNEVRLTPQEQRTYEQYRGQVLQQTAGALVSSPGFQQMPAYAQRTALENINTAASAAADRMLLRDIASGPGAGQSRMQATGVLAPVVGYGPDVMNNQLLLQQQLHHQALMQSLLGTQQPTGLQRLQALTAAAG